MKSAEYWKKRFEQVEQSQHDIGVSAYADIEQQYRKAQRQIEGQINAWYGRFAKNNNVSLEEARRMLTAKELDELKWDVHEYIKYGQENALNGQWIKELENASARFHISRLEALQLQTQQSLEVMFGNQLDTIDSAMSDVYKSGFYRTAFEIQKGFGVGWDFASLDDKQIAKVINKPWAADGKNFSQRVWGNRTKLVNELNQTLTRNIVLGQDPQKAIDEIAKKMNTSKHNAGRLVMTEEAFFSSEAQRDCFKELDVEEYEIVATLDSHTSDICQDMDGKHFKMSQWEVGTTAPPFHVYCRSTTVPYFADDFGVPGERAARMADGEPTYHVPADMTYKQWQKSFLGGGDKSGLNKVQPDVKIKTGKQNIETASTIEEARSLLTDKIGFREIEDSFKKVNDDLAIANTNQLNRLEQKFGAIHESTSTICAENGTGKAKNAIAYVSSGRATPTNQNLSLCPKWYKDKAKFIEEERKAVENFWSMPCAMTDEEIQIYSVTHEYGHMLQHILVKRRFEQDGWLVDKPMTFLNMKSRSRNAMFKWYNQRRKAVEDECFDEIIAIAKDKNPDFVLTDNLSRYGRTDKAEFFAEVFANSQLSKPNELGEAMNIWLKRKGLIK